jgi:hypothetical protein
MTAYLLILILAVAIPFLLYCLWNFARELRPHRSAALVSSRVTGPNRLWSIPATRMRDRPRIVSLRNESRAAS